MPPLILGIETSSSLCSLCLWQGGRSLVYEAEDIGYGHAAVFFKLLEQARDRANISFKDITHIAITRGPGSFTGIRVGLAIAKAFELAADIPLLGLTTFEVALQSGHYGDSPCFALDTKRGDFYGALYEKGEMHASGVWTEGEVRARTKPPRPLVTDQSEAFLGERVDVHSLTLTAEDVARAAETVMKIKPDSFSSDPFYLRPPKVYE